MQTTTKTGSVPLLNLSRHYEALRGELDAVIRACFLHQQWINGPEVAAFEGDVSKFLDVPHAVGVSSGTDALVLALRAFALARTGREHFTREDEIVTTAFTFTATGDAILRAGATPVFLDINPKTYTLDPAAVASYLARAHGRVVGMLPVHLYGHPADLDTLATLADTYGCFLLEDAAQAFGATWHGRCVGSLGDAGALSFFPSKPLGGFGDGGMVTTRDATVAMYVHELRQHGGKNKYDVEHLGYNARLDTMQAAILRVKLRYFPELAAKRQQIAAWYNAALATIPGITTPCVDPRAFHAYHQYTIRIADGRRDALQHDLTERGIGSLVYYPKPLHAMALFRGRAIVDLLPETDRAAREVLSIPIDPFQTETETANVASAIRMCMGV
ncbi:MAG: DegT/DnrJ/EryC1/StrS family aminotransferase [bacterium]|nr:DegT/DnrJ/EryC1/StrS family aminotransferase [bacterium]